MSDALSDLISSLDRTQEQAMTATQSIFSATRVGAVYGDPIQAGDYTIITASEVVAGSGFGFGRGMGSAPASASSSNGEAAKATEATGGGGGGGGGGGSTARPVALIVIGPNGVEVRPVVDVTKIAVAALTAWGAALPTLVRIGQLRKR